MEAQGEQKQANIPPLMTWCNAHEHECIAPVAPSESVIAPTLNFAQERERAEGERNILDEVDT